MLYDISPPIRPGLVVWPGDTPFSQERTQMIGPDSPVNVSSITLSTHTGAHTDAPLHYATDGTPVDGLDLDRYLGPCRVIDVRHVSGLIQPADIEASLGAAPPRRVLLHTAERAAIDHWNPDFTAISTAAIDLLAMCGVLLIGIDTPSIDPENSKTLDAHQAVCRHGLSILEGLVLDAVPAGDYELIALPLRLAELDAAPLRAILRDLPA